MNFYRLFINIRYGLPFFFTYKIYFFDAKKKEIKNWLEYIIANYMSCYFFIYNWYERLQYLIYILKIFVIDCDTSHKTDSFFNFFFWKENNIEFGASPLDLNSSWDSFPRK